MSIPRALRYVVSLTAGWFVACGSAVHPPVGIPPGSGWHCFAPHPEGSHAASCSRDQATCVRAVADAMEAARREATVTSFSSCRSQREAWCVAVGPRDAVCTENRADCETLRGTLEDPSAACVRTE